MADKKKNQAEEEVKKKKKSQDSKSEKKGEKKRSSKDKNEKANKKSDLSSKDQKDLKETKEEKNKEKKKDEKKKEEGDELVGDVDKSQLVSKKKVVYIDIDDEVTDIHDKLNSIKAKHVYIVAPKRSILFQSVVNLKILKRKAEESNKIIYFITNDSNGIYLAQRLGIQVYDKVSNEGSPSLFSSEAEDDKLRITPLKATVNSVEEETPVRLKEKKLSISEILRGKKESVMDVKKIKKKEKKAQKLGDNKRKMVIAAPNKHALIGLVATSLLILLVIVYIALPGVTIYITPTASVLEKSVNITLADATRNSAELEINPRHTIASYSTSVTVTQEVQHFATGKKFSERGANASGQITIYNTTGNPWPLVGETRFQTNEGIVYRIKDNITVPAATSEGPGSVESFVIADQVDAYGAVVGERGNIEPTTFFLPGLKEDSRSELYAESFEPMSGGVTDYITYISAEDIEAARERLEDELLKRAIDELRNEVNEKAKAVGGDVTYKLLEGDGAIKVGDVQIGIPANLENREVADFTLSGSVDVNGVYYTEEEMVAILRDELMLKKSPQKELLKIYDDSTSYRIFEWDEVTGKIKLTATIKGIEQFNINPEDENGERLLSKIRQHVAGKDILAAEQFIQNLPEVNKVTIDSWPAWSPTIPNLPENIDFEIRDASSVVD